MSKQMRKVRVGSVVRTRMDQTAVVEMVWKQRHRLYRKQVRRIARFYVHDPENQCRLGDVVRIEETRPITKTKHWRLLEILERRQVADVRPIELESDVEPILSPPPIVDEVEQDDEIGTAEDENEEPVAEEPEAEADEEPEEELQEQGEPDEDATDEGPVEEETELEESQNDQLEDQEDEETSDDEASEDEASEAEASDDEADDSSDDETSEGDGEKEE